MLPELLARPIRSAVVVPLSVAFVLASWLVASANVTVTTVSTDGFTNTSSFHKTEVEPDTFSDGSTIVGAFQVGRFSDGGASDIGWATTTNGGTSWSHGTMPSTTPYSSPTGPYARVTDPSVAYDKKHNVWMVSTIALNTTRGVHGVAVLVLRSTNGGTAWGGPVTIRSASRRQDFDKNWTTCDDTATSAFYGTCYTEYDDFGHGNQLRMSRSTDGGLTWQQASVPRNSGVIGGQPVAQPNGRVVVPIDNAYETSVESFVSTNGGASFTGPYAVANISDHGEAGNLRSGPLPSAEVDAAGKVYVVWSDCRFRTQCNANDIVMSTSTNGTSWTTPVRIPIDFTTSGVDHFLPGIALQPGTSGTTAHIGLIYYFYPVSNCGSSCQLDVGFISSSNGGATWSAATQLAGPMQLGWLPLTTQGRMVGDYMSASFAGSTAFPVFALGKAVSGKTCTLGDVTSCDESMVAPSTGLAIVQVSGGLAVESTPVPNARSDHPIRSAATWR